MATSPDQDSATTSRAELRSFLTILGRERRGVAIVLALNVVAASIAVVPSWLVGTITDRVIAGASLGAIDKLGAVILLSALAQLAVLRWARLSSLRLGERILAALRAGVVRNALGMPVRQLQAWGIGDIVTRSTQDVQSVAFTLQSALPDIVNGSLMIILTVGAVTVLEPVLGLCSLSGVVVIWAVTKWYLRRASQTYRTLADARGAVSDTLHANAAGAETIESFGLQAQRRRARVTRIRALRDSSVDALWLRTVLFPTVDIGHAIPVSVVLGVGSLLAINGSTSIGTVVSATLLTWQLTEPVDRILTWVDSVQAAGASLVRIEAVQARPRSATTAPIVTSSAIAVEDVSFSYRSGTPALDRVTFDVEPGERLAIVGRSGAGKSTLALLVSGLETPDQGSVRIGAAEVSDLEDDLRRRCVVLVTQDLHVFRGTIRQNLTLGHETSEESLMNALDHVNAGWVHDFEDGLATRVGDGGIALSPGRAQQLALARVVLADPAVVVLDEATSLMSPRSARDSEAALWSVLQARTVISVAHRIAIAESADRVLFLDGGRIVEYGAHEDLMTAGGAYARLWRHSGEAALS
jgi:ABC-type multidrug transport system fused ATPase/permease subunit